MTPTEHLKEHVDALVAEIVRADQSFYVLRTIAAHTDALNAKNYGEVFQLLQAVLQDRAVLAVGKLFDKESNRYPTQSVAFLLTFLKRNRDALRITQRSLLLREILAWNGVGLPDEPQDCELTDCIVAHYSDSRPNADLNTLAELDVALHALKTHRDKRIAHAENISPAQLPSAKWTDTRRLLDWARRLVSTVGMAYLGTFYTTPDGRYLLEDDARRAGVALSRLFKAAGIGKTETQEAEHGAARYAR